MTELLENGHRYVIGIPEDGTDDLYVRNVAEVIGIYRGIEESPVPYQS